MSQEMHVLVLSHNVQYLDNSYLIFVKDNFSVWNS